MQIDRKRLQAAGRGGTVALVTVAAAVALYVLLRPPRGANSGSRRIRIDGKPWRRVRRNLTKKDADNAARRIRKGGTRARVIKEAGTERGFGWAVYTPAEEHTRRRQTRQIDGKTYELWAMRSRKSEADKLAKNLRTQWDKSARVVRTGKRGEPSAWSVFASR